jgi:tRNA modification GTPase
MLGKLTGWDDTIVALATASGVSAIGVLRLSGIKSIGIVNQLFPSKNLEKQLSHTLHVGYLKLEEKVLDEVVISLYKSPKSYTGEDIVEISCHGSPYVLEQVMQSVIRLGARLAKPGEFTQRAFLNGKLDLIQAEAVADLIASNTEASQRNAMLNIRGGFSKSLRELREKLLSFSALIELELDFSQEDIEFADRKKFYELLNDAGELTENLIKSFKLGNVIKHGVQVAIVGKPNSGKSTLLNTLLKENRAIVSEFAGTTRDTIEEVINIKGILFRLIDTAGIRQHSSDIIENFGIERSLEKMEKADIVIYLFDSIEKISEIKNIHSVFNQKGRKFLLVANKVDLIGEEAARERFREIVDIIFISAKNELHIELLENLLVEKALGGNAQSEGTIVTNSRHFNALLKISDSLKVIRIGIDEKLPGDLLSSDIRRCLYYLGDITGEITTEDQLDYIFSKFCIGK